MKNCQAVNVWKFGGKWEIKCYNVYKLIYSAKYSKVAGSKGNKT